MHKHILNLGLCGAALLWSGIAAAQDVPAPAAPAQTEAQEGAIVVTGRKLPAKAVHRYVRQISSTIDGQLTRFRDPVCPLTIGFPERYNQIVARRIRAVAAEAGVRVAGDKCRANLVLVISPDADALIKDMRKKTPHIFVGVNDSDLKLAFRDGPVHMWNTVTVLNEDGQRQTGSTFTVKSASILNLPTQQVIAGSMIVIDDDATIGKSLTQIADYAAMRALAGARPPREGLEADTILTLFDGSVVAPPMVTSVDRSYLRGVYDANPTARATSAMGRISGQIRRDAEGRGEEKSED